MFTKPGMDFPGGVDDSDAVILNCDAVVISEDQTGREVKTKRTCKRLRGQTERSHFHNCRDFCVTTFGTGKFAQ
jgi:hypothetical protein